MKVLTEIANKNEVDKMFSETSNDTKAILMAHTFEGTMKSRGINITIDELNFSRVSYMAWNYQAPLQSPIAWGAPAGFGKSTMLETWVAFNGNSNDVLWGAIVVKPKREHVIEFCESVNRSTDGKLTASPILGKTNGMTEEAYLQQFKDQERAPVLVMTHKMFEILVSQNKLISFTTWIDSEGNSRRRTNLFIDERPAFTETPKLTTTKIERLTELVRAVSMASNDFHKGYVAEIDIVAEKLKEQLKRHIEKAGRQTFKVGATDPLFTIPTELYYDWLKYSDVTKGDYNLLGLFEEAVRRGGTCESNKLGVGLMVGRTIWQKITFLNVHVLDASTIGDKNYNVTQFNKIAPVTPEGAYSNLTIKNCYKHNIGRSFYDMHKQGFTQTVKLAKELATQHNKLLVVVYQKHFDKYQEALASEIEAKKIQLKYFDDERSSNSFRDCDAILFLGINRKSPAFYIETAKAIYSEDFSTEFDNRGGQSFQELAIQDYFESDMVADRNQGIGRMRPYKSTGAKTVYMFCTYEEVVEGLKEEFEGATFEEWTLPFSLTGKEKEPTSKENFIEWLHEFSKQEADSSVKAKEVYVNRLQIHPNQWTKIKKDKEVLTLMEILNISFKGQSIVKL